MPSVLIVGAGPAGSAAAIRCAQAGFDVTLVEGEAFPRDRPGETLHPGVEPLFRQLGIDGRARGAGFLRHAGIQIERQRESRFEAYGVGAEGSWLGFHVMRSLLDEVLLERARECGTRILQPVRARGPIVRKGRVAGILTDAGPVQADYTFDASGSCSWLGRCLGLTHRVYSPRYFAQFGYARGSLPTELDCPLFRQSEGGWVWLAQVELGLYHWTRLVTTSRLDPQWRPREYAGLQPVGRAQARDVTWRHAWPSAGRGWLLLGDAAAILDPSSSHGVLRALMSGIMAAHVVTRIRQGRLREATAMHAYQDWLLGRFREEVVKLTEAISVRPTPARALAEARRATMAVQNMVSIPPTSTPRSPELPQ